MPYIPFTDEQKLRANSVDLAVEGVDQHGHRNAEAVQDLLRLPLDLRLDTGCHICCFGCHNFTAFLEILYLFVWRFAIQNLPTPLAGLPMVGDLAYNGVDLLGWKAALQRQGFDAGSSVRAVVILFHTISSISISTS